MPESATEKVARSTNNQPGSKRRELSAACLFAGMGGFACALRNGGGGGAVWANEVDKHACSTFRHNCMNSVFARVSGKKIIHKELTA